MISISIKFTILIKPPHTNTKYYVILEEQKNILEGNGLFTENLSSGMITFDKNYADKSLEFIYFYIYE